MFIQPKAQCFRLGQNSSCLCLEGSLLQPKQTSSFLSYTYILERDKIYKTWGNFSLRPTKIRLFMQFQLIFIYDSYINWSYPTCSRTTGLLWLLFRIWKRAMQWKKICWTQFLFDLCFGICLQLDKKENVLLVKEATECPSEDSHPAVELL